MIFIYGAGYVGYSLALLLAQKNHVVICDTDPTKVNKINSCESPIETESEFDMKMSDNCCQPFLIYSLNTKKINIYTPKTIEADVNILERIKAVA